MPLGLKCPIGLSSRNWKNRIRKRLSKWNKQIDEGESAAIALTMQMQAEWLLTDDTAARQFGESLGLEIHGSVGLLLWAVAVNQVGSENEALNFLDALAGSSLWISDRVVQSGS